MLLASLMTSLLMIGLSPSPPVIEVSDLGSLDEGCKVTIRGIVVDSAAFDSGTDLLVLLDHQGSETANVYASPGGKARPSMYALVGDELEVTGRLSMSGLVPVLYSDSDQVSLVSRSEDTLTVAMVCDNWQLFLWDSFSVEGRVVVSSISGEFQLVDALEEHGCRIESGGASDLSVAVGQHVIVSGRLVMDYHDMSLELVVRALSLAP